MNTITVAEAATLCEVTPATVRQWVRRYGIPKVLIDGCLHLDEGALLAVEYRLRTAPRGGPTRRGA